MLRILAVAAMSLALGCGKDKACRVDNGDGTTTDRCTSGTRELVCTNPDCSGITSLTIQDTDLTSVNLSNLVTIEGLYISYNPALLSVDLPSLTTVTNQLFIKNSALVSLSLPALTSGKVWIQGCPAMTSMSLPAMTSGTVEIIGNVSLNSLSLPALIHGGIVVSGTGLTSLSLPALSTADVSFPNWGPNWGPVGGVDVGANAALTSVSLPVLTFAGHLGVQGTQALTSIYLPALTTLTYDLDIANNSALASLDLPALTIVGLDNGGQCYGHRLGIADNSGLTNLSLPSLSTVYCGYAVVGNTELPQCEAEAILAQLVDFTGTATITGNDTTATCPP